MLLFLNNAVDKGFEPLPISDIYLYNLPIQNFLPQLSLLFQNVVIVFCVRCSLQQKCRFEQVLVLYKSIFRFDIKILFWELLQFFKK